MKKVSVMSLLNMVGTGGCLGFASRSDSLTLMTLSQCVRYPRSPD